MSETFFPKYPPNISDENLQSLKNLAIDWSLSHGLIIRPPTNVSNNSFVMHAPVSLFPSPFPRKTYEEAIELQPMFNLLFHKLSQDSEFITQVVEEITKVDDFVDNLYKIYLKVKEEGIVQPISLGLHRSDYLLQVPPDATEANILQVEFNTISSSFSSLSYLTGELHRYLLKATEYYNSSELLKSDSLPLNDSMTSIPKGIAKAHELYGSPNAVVMMVVIDEERNIFDQKWIEYDLLNNNNIHIIRKTLKEINEQGKLDPNTKALVIDDKEVSVTYFRSGYSPEQHPTKKEWDARLLIERSKSIKCPSVSYQLVGAKKVQQVLAIPGVLEKYVTDPTDAKRLRASFAGLYPLDSSPEGEAAVKLALGNPEYYVMKPQREGGGNNIYANDIPSILSKLSVSERSSYILMDLIQPPLMKNIILRQGELVEGEMISELGIYGIFIGGKGKDEVIINEIGGHLLRTKGRKTNEGGVASGYAVIDSPLLI
ncbi:glutathione synthase [Rhizophagus irregularis]|uniref:Glutathione synthetase n=1 Tax=Rhizophagus irregularis TaxID=588596 RepID=A0A2N0SHC6_9GLOM|nr:glutathione synthase [Rhizophagus irregularis]